MGSEETPNSNHINERPIGNKKEGLDLAQFLEQTSDFSQKIENRFEPLLGRIDIYRCGQLYRGTKKQL